MQTNAHSASTASCPRRGNRQKPRDSLIWPKTHACVLKIYRCTQNFPTEERFGLTSQLRRAATTVFSNIAEGCGREGDRERARFLSIAAGSASEVEYQLLLTHALGFLEDEPYGQLDSQVGEVKRMLNAFIRTLS